MSTETRPAETADGERGRSRKTTGYYAPLEDFVRGKVEALQRAYLDADRPARRAGATASLARLRRAVGRPVGSDPAVWEETLGGLPEEYASDADDASAGENAAHAAITLYGIHQQSRGSARMHVRGHSIGSAVSRLAVTNTSSTSTGVPDREQAVVRRFHMLGTAITFAEVVHHARGLITQLRGESIPLDYGRLAVDLARLQSASTADRVRLDWGRDFYFHKPEPTDESVDADETN
jgi:CRISPR system Cascade subunit CasB